MKIVLNPMKPLYIDSNNKNIRMGNFPETGKEIDYEDELFEYFFNLIKEYQDTEKVKEIMIKKGIEESEFNQIIEYLMNEKFIIPLADYEEMIKDKYLNREILYFNMINNSKINIDILKEKKVLILGLGGVGSITAELLTRAGVQNFILVDCDKVEYSNLIRQLSYTSNDIGKNKTEALSLRLQRINPNVNIKSKNIMISKEEDVYEFINQSDLVVCTLDKPFRKIRRIINRACVKTNTPVIFAGFAEHVGMIGPFIIPNKGPCLECIDKKSNEVPVENVNIVPSYGPLCNIIASIISDQILNYFLKLKSKKLVGKTMMFNMYTYKTKIFTWKRNHDCEVCKKNDSK